MTDTCTIGIDLGGTDIKAALVDRDLNIIKQTTTPTAADQGSDAVINNILAVVDQLKAAPPEPRDSSRAAARSEVVAIGVGTPGPLSPGRGIVFQSVHLPGWHNLPLRDMIAQRTRLPVAIDNDANVAAYGEYRVHPSVSNLVLLTLGTGVGAGTILDGRIFHGHHENASEWGHMIVHPGGRPCKCGQQGCLEMYASAANVARHTTEQIHAGTESSLADRLSAGKSIDAADVVSAARSGDALALKTWDEACRALAVACVNIQHALNPQRILLGGGMSRAANFLLDPVRRHYDAMHWHLHHDHPEIALATLTNNAGVIGAAALAWDACE
ncbi:MAG: ROK family protein [Phycisphaerae bacterium]